jgi:hypothetical protein
MKFLLGGDGPVSPKDRAEQEQWQERIRQDADPGILARVRRVEHHPMLPSPRSLPMALRPMTTRFDDPLHQWHVGYLRVKDDIDLPYELQRDLHECVPQSILRDVFRPTTSFDWTMEPLELEPDRTGAQAIAQAKAALVREPLPTIESGLSIVSAEQRRRKRFVATPWKTALRDDQPRQYYEVEGVIYREMSEGDGGESGDDES